MTKFKNEEFLLTLVYYTYKIFAVLLKKGMNDLHNYTAIFASNYLNFSEFYYKPGQSGNKFLTKLLQCAYKGVYLLF